MEDSLFVQITDFSDKMIAAQSCKFLESRSAGLLSYSSHAVINAYHTDASKLADKTPSFAITFIGAEKKTERDSIFSYIEYKISLLKQIDGTQHFVMKRYRDLKSFFSEIANEGLVKELNGLNFPGSNVSNTEDWFTGEAHNPDGAFINSRKKMLQLFFQKIFRQNPNLWKDQRTVKFFQLHAVFSDGTAKSQDQMPLKSFYLRDKYKGHIEERIDRSRYQIEGDNAKFSEMTGVINLNNARAAWDV